MFSNISPVAYHFCGLVITILWLDNFKELRRNLEQKVAEISKLRSDEVAALNTEIYQGTDKLERDLAQLQRELTSAKSDVKKMEN